MKLPKVLPQPPRPIDLPNDVKWLSGEGAGSWFFIESVQENYRIIRYSPKGKFECEGLFSPKEKFLIVEDFKMDYPSHCGIVHIKQNGIKIKFTPVA